ncbi:MAG: carbonic anhydrase [Candidatus Meridianibacter frigidus]|nr:MAG: carbonic anhydrase [Candidatus Eremiobacteraeota bacterium]
MRSPFDHALSRAAAIRLGGGSIGALAFGRLAALAAAPPAIGVSSTEALARLAEGNGRFVAGSMTNQDGITERRLALAQGQAPFATILTCSDSRVPPELVFDQNVGDLFVSRNAGNFVDDTVLGTVEYGYSVLGSKLIMVLGHDSCGAVSATYDAIKDYKPLPPHLDAIENGIQAGIASIVSSNGTKNAASVANAKAQAAKFASRSTVLGPGIASGDLKVVAAVYHLGSGKVEMVY